LEKKDYDLIKTSLEGGKTNENKINNLLIASNTLKSEVSKLVNFFSNQVEEILKTQSLETRIEGLLDKYEKKKMMMKMSKNFWMICISLYFPDQIQILMVISRLDNSQLLNNS